MSAIIRDDPDEESEDDIVPDEMFEHDEELGVSDDNWACGTLDPET